PLFQTYDAARQSVGRVEASQAGKHDVVEPIAVQVDNFGVRTTKATSEDLQDWRRQIGTQHEHLLVESIADEDVEVVLAEEPDEGHMSDSRRACRVRRR